MISGLSLARLEGKGDDPKLFLSPNHGQMCMWRRNFFRTTPSFKTAGRGPNGHLSFIKSFGALTSSSFIEMVIKERSLIIRTLEISGRQN